MMSFFNPLERILRRTKKKQGHKFLILWNRGLGDIPLGLYALTNRILEEVQDARVHFLTRPDLEEVFTMVKGADVIVAPNLKRGQPMDLDALLAEQGMSRNDFDCILEKPDPTRWLKWQLGKVTPRLMWDPKRDALADHFSLPKGRYVGAHVQTETGQYYGYEKNWPQAHWQELFQRMKTEGVRVLLFGLDNSIKYSGDHIIDLRGKTNLFEMLSLIKNRCQYLVAPDSGVLSVAYYIDANFPIRCVSLWSDPRQGVLKQNVPSPNLNFEHMPMIAEDEDLKKLSVDEVHRALFQHG